MATKAAVRATADVVIIGGGVMGLHTAYQLSLRAPDLRISLFEKGKGVGEGSSGYSSAFLRCLYSREETTQLACDALRVHKNWNDYLQRETDPRFTSSPILWMANKTQDQLAKMVGMLESNGLTASMMSYDDVEARWPLLSACACEFDSRGEKEFDCDDDDSCRVVSHYLCENDSGYFDPTGALRDLTEACRDRGVDVHFGAAVKDVVVNREANGGQGQVQGVVLADGTTVSSGTIVNAAGPWCNYINERAGIKLPFTFVPVRIPVMYKSVPDIIKADLDEQPIPAVFDTFSGIYFRPQIHSGQLLVSTVKEEEEREQVDPSDFNTSLDPDIKQYFLNSLHHRIPSLPTSGRVTGFSALYTVTLEDVHPCIGETSVKGMYVANGFSGHGFKLSPGVGSMLAKAITNLDGEYNTSVDPKFFDPYRKPIDMPNKNVLA